MTEVDDQKAPKAPQKTDDTSADAQKDAPGCVVRMPLDQDRIMTKSVASRLEPGMAVSAEIKTGKRLIIQYIISPIKRASHESITER